MSANFQRSPTRRNILLAVAGMAPALFLSHAQAAGMSQASVSYQETPKDGKRCDGCKLFVAPKSCKSVSGDIAPSGWCKLWIKSA